MEDEQLIALLEQRSERALGELDTRYGRLCRRLALQVLGSREDAEECVDDAWMAVWRTIPPQHPTCLRAFVCRITRNMALTRYHAQTAKKRCPSCIVALEELADALEGDRRVEDALDEKTLTGRLTAFLDGLEREDRVLFMRRYWYGDSVQDLARQTGRSPGGVAVRLHRLRAGLRNELEKEGIL